MLMADERRKEIEEILENFKTKDNCDSPFEWKLILCLQDVMDENKTLLSKDVHPADKLDKMVIASHDSAVYFANNRSLFGIGNTEAEKIIGERSYWLFQIAELLRRMKK